MSLQCSSQDSSEQEEKEEREDKPSSSHLSTHLETMKMKMKKNLATTSQSRANITTASGNLVKTLSTHKTKDSSSGKPDPMPHPIFESL